MGLSPVQKLRSSLFGVRMMDLYIIGTHHQHQFGRSKAYDANEQACDAFFIYLRDQCLSLGVRTVAEEMSTDARHKWSISRTVPELVALELQLEHADCDPTEEERRDLGVLNDGYVRMQGLMHGNTEEMVQKNIRHEYDKREDEWLRRLARLPRWPVLFVCGCEHSSSLAVRAKEFGLCARLILDEWAPKIRMRQEVQKAESR